MIDDVLARDPIARREADPRRARYVVDRLEVIEVARVETLGLQVSTPSATRLFYRDLAGTRPLRPAEVRNRRRAR
jgi:hypothetical protein